MKKSVKNFICILLCVLVPFALFASLGFFIPAQFDRTFLGELKYKVDRLYSIKEPKIVVIGGSSVPFGVNSALLEEALGMPVVNFGLYATLGTKMMLDLSLGAIGDGDIVIIAPETDAQTYSLYFNAEAAWQACDSDFSMLLKMSSDEAPKMFGGFWKYVSQKLKYALAENHLDPSGVYNRASFNEYGDISYERPYNVMELGYDSTSAIPFSPDIISDDFVAYVNDYTEKAEKRGAKVYFSFSPMNQDAVPIEIRRADIDAFAAYIDENFTAKRISDPNFYVYESGYFYDSNFHVNDAGMTLHTATLAADIAAALGVELKSEIEIPPAPKKPDDPDDPGDPGVEYDENEKYFLFEEMKVKNETVGYKIVGTTDEGRTQQTLTTPVSYNGKKVISVGENAFAGCDMLKEIYIKESINNLDNGAFADAQSLEIIHLLRTDPDSFQVDQMVKNPSEGLCRGMSPIARFYVPTEAYDDYCVGYFWATYSDYLLPE